MARAATCRIDSRDVRDLVPMGMRPPKHLPPGLRTTHYPARGIWQNCIHRCLAHPRQDREHMRQTQGQRSRHYSMSVALLNSGEMRQLTTKIRWAFLFLPLPTSSAHLLHWVVSFMVPLRVANMQLHLFQCSIDLYWVTRLTDYASNLHLLLLSRLEVYLWKCPTEAPDHIAWSGEWVLPQWRELWPCGPHYQRRRIHK